MRRSSGSRAALADAGHECYLVGGSVRDALIDDVPGRSSTSPPTPGPSASRRCSRRSADHVVAPGQAVRHGRRAGRRRARARSRPTAPRCTAPTRRKPEVSFGDAIETGPLAARLHGQRDGAAPARRACSSTRSTARPTSPSGRLRTPARAGDLASPTTRCACCAAARFIAALRLRARRPSWSRPRSRELGDRLEIVSVGARSATSCRSCSLVDDPSAGLWFLASTGLADQFLPELNAMQLEQDPIHHHKDVLAHTIAVVAEDEPRPRAAARRAAARRRQAEDALVRARPRARSTTTRWSARAWRASG